MKKIILALAVVSAFVLTSCHYGQDEAKATLKRNEEYKGDKADYSVNRAGEGGKHTEEVAAPAVADSTSTK